MKIFIHTYNNIITIENLLSAWTEFSRDKKKKPDVVEFSLTLMDNIFSLFNDLRNREYKHSGYKAFKINDPKPRDIHKALVRDRILHHLIYKALYEYFDKKFIYDSYSCRLNKGTHKAIYRFESFGRKESKNNTKTVYILKCDIKKFFVNIDRRILKEILSKYIQDRDILNLLSNIIDSFPKGLPLGNLTSQLLVNIYMNEFDQYMKHKLKIKYYIRYADDFVIFSRDRNYLESILINIQDFLKVNLKLQLHSDKVFIKTLNSGVDFLGFVHFPNHRVLRTSTKRRMFRNLRGNDYKEESVNSYLGMLSHGDGFKLKKKILENCGMV
ncbi:MAG: group II intron reverse transcriptase domain-containing protein [Candidatus Pacebacteria bacterium]|nr:group II intron reverse transcriptase domain-containing protein [Candidatus Paceibacterota bacterium]